jgi:hypothetical protein
MKTAPPTMDRSFPSLDANIEVKSWYQGGIIDAAQQSTHGAGAGRPIAKHPLPGEMRKVFSYGPLVERFCFWPGSLSRVP